jgi:hypothetical protein
MTWKYQTSDDVDEMDIWDHTDTLVKTLQNDGTGFTIPDDVTDVMRSEAAAARDNGNMERWRDIHIRLADDDIEQGAP